MKSSAVWVCPDCGTKLAAPEPHLCPHLGIVCVPGVCGGPPSSSRDECAQCARKTLLLNFTSAPSSGFAVKNREREAVAESARGDAREASRVAAAEHKSTRRARETEEKSARAEAQKNMADHARAALAQLRAVTKWV